jgi:hypothetical protein
VLEQARCAPRQHCERLRRVFASAAARQLQQQLLAPRLFLRRLRQRSVRRSNTLLRGHALRLYRCRDSCCSARRRVFDFNGHGFTHLLCVRLCAAQAARRVALLLRHVAQQRITAHRRVRLLRLSCIRSGHRCIRDRTCLAQRVRLLCELLLRGRKLRGHTGS